MIQIIIEARQYGKIFYQYACRDNLNDYYSDLFLSQAYVHERMAKRIHRGKNLKWYWKICIPEKG